MYDRDGKMKEIFENYEMLCEVFMQVQYEKNKEYYDEFSTRPVVGYEVGEKLFLKAVDMLMQRQISNAVRR